jgi:hypothetical protein
MTESTRRPVIVTTEFKGVFFGFATDTSGDTIKLSGARCAMYWADGGWMKLAQAGPGKDDRISATADIDVRKVTAVAECTEEATAKWLSAPVYKSR